MLNSASRGIRFGQMSRCLTGYLPLLEGFSRIRRSLTSQKSGTLSGFSVPNLAGIDGFAGESAFLDTRSICHDLNRAWYHLRDRHDPKSRRPCHCHTRIHRAVFLGSKKSDKTQVRQFLVDEPSDGGLWSPKSVTSQGDKIPKWRCIAKSLAAHESMTI